MIKTILCIDDDPITLMLCKKVITKVSFSEEIIFASNGQEAYELLKKLCLEKELGNVPNLIFLDLNMPVMNGWEFLDSIETDLKSNLKNTKVIILSSTIDPADYNKAKQYEMVSHFLSKPITVDMLENLKPIYS